MNAGDILRLRNVRTYGADPRNYFEFTPDREKAKDLKRVFVCMLVGTEGFELVNRKGDQVMAPLNVERAMNKLGWWSEQQIEAALQRKNAKTNVIDRLRDWLNKQIEAQRKAREKK